MIRAAVIGGIGSGKTFVAKLFKCPVFNADDEVKIIYKTNKVCFNKLKKNCQVILNLSQLKRMN